MCVQLAVDLFYNIFHNRILHLLSAFPEDRVVE